MPLSRSSSDSALSSQQADVNLNVNWMNGGHLWILYAVLLALARYLLVFTSAFGLDSKLQWTSLFVVHGVVRRSYAVWRRRTRGFAHPSRQASRFA